MAKYLDSTGLSYFWEKIKTWVLSSIKSGVNTTQVGKTTEGMFWSFGTDKVTLNSQNEISAEITRSGVKVAASNNNNVLLGGGGTKQLATAGGIATLDSNGHIPLSQLGNLDATVAEVVTALPTSNIKKHIYLVPSSITGANNIYTEYIYVGDTSATYNASKWEELGKYEANIDLSPYATNSSLSSHTNNKSNPHQVTKAQVGLGNVNNTSDADKPVSTPQQTALNGKVDKVSGKGLSTNDYTNDDKTKVGKAITTDGGILTDSAHIMIGDFSSKNSVDFSKDGLCVFENVNGVGGSYTFFESGKIICRIGSSDGLLSDKTLLLPSIQNAQATLLTSEDVKAISNVEIDALDNIAKK